MSQLSPQSQAIAKALGRRLAWRASLAGAYALAALGFLAALAVPFVGACLLITEAASLVFPTTPGLGYPEIVPRQAALCALALGAYAAFDMLFVALPLMRKKYAWSWADAPRQAFVFLISPLYLFMDRFSVFATGQAGGVGPTLGAPAFDLPASSAFSQLGALNGPPASLRQCLKPWAIALGFWPAMAAKAFPAVFMLATGLLGFVWGMSMTPLAILAALLFWLARQMVKIPAGLSPAALRSKAQAAAERLASEGSADLAGAEDRALRAQSASVQKSQPPSRL